MNRHLPQLRANRVDAMLSRAFPKNWVLPKVRPTRITQHFHTSPEQFGVLVVAMPCSRVNSEDFARAIGAIQLQRQELTIKLPSKDRNGQPISERGAEVEDQILQLLLNLGGGANKSLERGYWGSESPIEEDIVNLSAFVDPHLLEDHFQHLRSLLHQLGRDANQDAIMVVLDGKSFLITDYDHVD